MAAKKKGRPKAAPKPAPGRGSAGDVDKMVGHKVRLARMMNGLSQVELAGRINVSYQQFQKYENGANRLSVARLHAIAKALDLPMSYFFEEGDGEELGRDRQLIEIMRLVRKAPPEIRSNILGLLRASVPDQG